MVRIWAETGGFVALLLLLGVGSCGRSELPSAGNVPPTEAGTAATTGAGDPDGTTGESSGRAPTETTGGPSGDVTVGDTRGATTSGGGSTTGGDPTSVCDPQPRHFEQSLVLDGDPGPYWGAFMEHREDRCTVERSEDAVGLVALDLECVADDVGPHSHSIRVTADGLPAVDLAGGDTVTLGLFVAGNWCWSGCPWLAVYDAAGDLAFAYSDAEAPAPFEWGWQGPPPSDWFMPLQVSPVDGLCDVESIDEDGGTTFIDDPICSYTERGAIDVGFQGTTTRIYDGAQAALAGGTYWMQVRRARFFRPTGNCTDQPEAAFSIVVARPRP